MAAKLSIRWSVDADLSFLHAAEVVASGGLCSDRKTEQALAGPVTEINSRLLSASLDMGAFWQRLLDERLSDPNHPNACSIALLDAGCSELQVEQTASVITNRLSEARMAFQRRFPKLAEQLDLRGRPIRTQWDTYGPGLLNNIALQIWSDSPPADWWPTRIDGLLIQPMRGGDGGYESNLRKFWIEAMLTDADQSVPEVLRVAWLVTQLAVEVHTRERSSESPSSLPWEIGCVPMVLSAGRELDLVKGDTLPLEAALRLWNLGTSETSGVLLEWWEQARASSSPIPVSLKQLDQMLEPVRAAQTRNIDAGIDLTDFDG